MKPAALLTALVLPAIAGCAAPAQPADATADPSRGAAVIEQAGCGGCHTIPGILGAHGLVGPPLLWFSRRTFIAGRLPNTADNLAGWIRSPHSVDPDTAMPELGLNDQQARDVAAYLRTLR